MASKFSDLLGKTIKGIYVNEYKNAVMILLETGEAYMMHHNQNCCESVRLEDVCGEFDDLVGSEILVAEEVSNSDDPPPDCAESFTWTFYKLSTIKGSVTLRWLGESSGYYSEEVDFELIHPED